MYFENIILHILFEIRLYLALIYSLKCLIQTNIHIQRKTEVFVEETKTKTENQIRTFLQNFNMNNDEHEAKLEGLKNTYKNGISSVKLLDQSILNITCPDDYENELIESEEYYDTSFELLAKISQKLNRI